MGIPLYPTGILISLVIWIDVSRYYPSQHTLGSKREPCKHRARPDHA